MAGGGRHTGWHRLVGWVAPLPHDALPRRLAQLYLGVVLYGVSSALIVRGRLGVDPWDVLQQGLARHTGVRIGTWAIVVGVAVLLLWIPLRMRPGLGTLSNVVVVGLTLNVALDLIAVPHALWLRAAVLVGGILLNGVATGCYIGAGLGPGPRDGLMVGLASRGHSIRAVRTCIELTVVGAGWLLGGNVGLGTLAYALSIGPLAHVLIPWFDAGRGAGARIKPTEVR